MSKAATGIVRAPWYRRYAYPIWGFVLLAFAAVLLVSTLDDMGLTDDDDFYVPAGKDYALWLQDAVGNAIKGDFSGFKRQTIDRRWYNNHEHPAVAKMVMGLSWLVLHKWLGWMGQIDAARMGVILFSLMLCYLIFRFSWEIFGPRAAVFAVLAFLTMPRSFFHMHVATLDMPTAATVFLVVYAVWRAEKSRWWILWAGVFYGVALCTKLNGPFVVFPLVIYWLYRWRQSVVLGAASALKFWRMFATGLSMALLSFPVFWLLWPWIWNETIARLTSYFKFHFYHYGIRLLYFGDIYLDPFAPWHAPLVYAAVTLPLVILVLGLIGMTDGLRQLGLSNLRYFLRSPYHRSDYALLCAINVLFAIGIVMFSGGPKYGGVKLFQPAYPFFAVLAGFGFELLVQRIQNAWPWFSIRARRLVPVLGLLLLMPGVIAMIRVYPYMLSYYNSLIGGPMGATEAGMERQYYDMCYRTTIRFWDEYDEKNVRLTYEPNVSEYRRTYPWYQRDKKLRRDVHVVNADHAEYLVLTHERRWGHYQELVQQYRGFPKIHTERVWGTPLYTIYDLREHNGNKKPVRKGPIIKAGDKKKPVLPKLNIVEKKQDTSKPDSKKAE